MCKLIARYEVNKNVQTFMQISGLLNITNICVISEKESKSILPNLFVLSFPFLFFSCLVFFIYLFIIIFLKKYKILFLTSVALHLLAVADDATRLFFSTTDTTYSADHTRVPPKNLFMIHAKRPG